MIDNLPDAIQAVVSDMQEGLGCSVPVVSGSGITTLTYCTANNPFVEGMYVTFSSEGVSGSWEIQRYEVTKLTIESVDTYTVQVSTEISQLNGRSDVTIKPFIRYKYGHPEELNKVMIEEQKDSTIKKNQFPILLLFLENEKSRHKESGVIFEANPNLVIIVDTQKNWKAPDRKTNSFEQKLWPLYDLFMDKLITCGLFQTDENLLISHSDKDCYFYSLTDAKDQNVFAGILDAIEINKLNLILNEQSNC